MIRHLAILIGLLILNTYPLSAQSVGAEVGIQAGAAHYFGDINPDYGLNRPGLSAGLIGRYSFNNRIAVKASFNYARVSGFDSDSDNEFQLRRNLDFKSDILNGGLQFEFNFLPFVHGDKDRFFTPYIFGGASMSYFNPKTEFEGTKYNLRDFGTEGQGEGDEYNITTAGWLYGGGIKYSLNYHWSINVELSMHELFTDYLDDVSTVYPIPFDLFLEHGQIAVELSDRSIVAEGQPAIGEPGRQRGNSANDDSYAILNVGVTYFLGKLKCPPISRNY
jgi:opacity protein-like surface antigen